MNIAPVQIGVKSQSKKFGSFVTSFRSIFSNIFFLVAIKANVLVENAIDTNNNLEEWIFVAVHAIDAPRTLMCAICVYIYINYGILSVHKLNTVWFCTTVDIHYSLIWTFPYSVEKRTCIWMGSKFWIILKSIFPSVVGSRYALQYTHIS